MQTRFIDREMTYDGTQLRSHFNYEQVEILGDSVLAFIGPCDVAVADLVDLEDARHGRIIKSQSMLHFIGEFYGLSLTETILWQRLMISQLQQRLMKEKDGLQLRRNGNDLYDGEFKLSVSIATTSAVSTLIHVGINIVSQGTPVPTKGLRDYGIAPQPFAKQVLADFQEEWSSLGRDRAKVRPVN